MSKYFITATDTDAGKTYVACALIHALTTKNINNKPAKVAAYKPISAGCTLVDDELINEDAQLLTSYANCNQSILDINPIAFLEPIAPHIAASSKNVQLTPDKISKNFEAVKALSADYTLVEGAGGWRLPLGGHHFMSDFVKEENLSVILVVNMKLGCLNHAILTYESIINDGLSCVAWVANCQETMDYLEENIAELKTLLPIPLMAVLPKEPDITKAALTLDLSVI